MDLEHDAIDKQIDNDDQNNQMNIHIDGQQHINDTSNRQATQNTDKTRHLNHDIVDQPNQQNNNAAALNSRNEGAAKTGGNAKRARKLPMIDFDEQDAYMREMQNKQPYESEV